MRKNIPNLANKFMLEHSIKKIWLKKLQTLDLFQDFFSSATFPMMESLEKMERTRMQFVACFSEAVYMEGVKILAPWRS